MIKYPDRLIPSDTDVILNEIDDEHFVGRFHDPIDFSAFNENGEFNFDVIDFYKIPGLSSNLLPPSKLKDLKIEITNYNLLKEWEPGVEIPEITEDDFQIKDEREVYFFHAEDIRVSIDYLYNEEEFRLNIDLKHKPLVSNVSHCEFIILDTRRKNPEKSFSSKKERHNLIAHELKLSMQENVMKPD